MKFIKKVINYFKDGMDDRTYTRLMWINSKAFWFFMDWIAPILSALVVSVLVNYLLRK
ncbi:hypothetical protein [Anaerococcus lactolyticus]|uniref:hypothetical protein n=1 Tax=Anaerococcus lactolyticus TaxID=33032 RepID=UPI0023F1FD1D|nr:hypothetical protein [Anaerococcus lactolyticus]